MEVDQEGVVIAEPTGQCLGQRRDLHPELAHGQVRQHTRVTFPGDHRPQDRPPGPAGDVRCDDGQLDPCVLQHLLQTLRLAGAFPGDRGPGPGEVTQMPDRLGRDERGPDQPVRRQLGQPGGVRDIGLAAGQVLGVSGIDEHHLERPVLEHVVERLPVVTGRLHRHARHCGVDQVVAQRQDVAGHRGPRGDLLGGAGLTGRHDSQADLRVPFGQVQPGAPRVQDLHRLLLPVERVWTAGRAIRIRSLTYVLVATVRGSRGCPAPHTELLARTREVVAEVDRRPPFQCPSRRPMSLAPPTVTRPALPASARAAARPQPLS